MDYYEHYIKPREIIKDINFYFDRIKELILYELYPKFLLDKKKKIFNPYYVNNFLSIYDKTLLQFYKDKLVISFQISDTQKSIVELSKKKYENYKINNLDIHSTIYLTEEEIKNKTIYDINPFFNELRKNIYDINEFFIDNFYKKERKELTKLNKKFIDLKETSISKKYNYLIGVLIDCSDEDFENKLSKLKSIIRGIKSSTLDVIFKITHEMYFYKKYKRFNNQIKIERFINQLNKELDIDNIMLISNKLCDCFNHEHLENYEEFLIFIKNVIIHFNRISYEIGNEIDEFISKNWKSHCISS